MGTILVYLGGGQPPETPDRSGNIAAREYTLIDIVNATNNLVDQINGQGGFAPVYKGTLENGQPVAIKLLSAYSDAATPRFLSEVFDALYYLCSINNYS